jgi:hypothetical protein
LWVDCIAAAVAGAAVLMLSGWLSRLYGLPLGLLRFTGAVNLLYGSYSFVLATRTRRPIASIAALVFANLAWALLCVHLAVNVARSPTAFGLAYLFGEAIFVAALATLEWRYRAQLLVAHRQARQRVTRT